MNKFNLICAKLALETDAPKTMYLEIDNALQAHMRLQIQTHKNMCLVSLAKRRSSLHVPPPS